MITPLPSVFPVQIVALRINVALVPGTKRSELERNLKLAEGPGLRSRLPQRALMDAASLGILIAIREAPLVLRTCGPRIINVRMATIKSGQDRSRHVERRMERVWTPTLRASTSFSAALSMLLGLFVHPCAFLSDCYLYDRKLRKLYQVQIRLSDNGSRPRNLDVCHKIKIFR